jgi:hypothetical protein
MDKMRNRLGESIRFVPIEEGVSWNYSRYLAAVEPASPFADVRLFCDPRRIAKFLEMEECTGKINGVARDADGPYFLVDATSVMEHKEKDGWDDIPFDPEYDADVVDLTVGPNGNLVDEKEFESLTKHGCGICSGDVFFEDDLIWRLDAPICMKCQDVEKVTANNIAYIGERE